MIHYTKPAEKLYCDTCKQFVDYFIVTKKEEYVIKGRRAVIDAYVAVCKQCGTELIDIYLEGRNMEKALEKLGLR